MRKKSQKKLKQEKEIALSRIKKLFKQASLEFKNNPSLSNRYVTLARKISQKIRVRIPIPLKRRFCKHCYKYLMPGANCNIRLRKNQVTYFCKNCKKYMRFPTSKR